MLKDERLNELVARNINVAQFVSFGPPNSIRFHGIRGLTQAIAIASIKEAIEALLEKSFIKSTDIRTFLPDKPDGNPFIKDVRNSEEITERVKRFLAEGYYVIVGERIPIEGSGRFGGVLRKDILEGAPNATPRCVDEEGTPLPVLSLERRIGIELLERIYGCVLQFPFAYEDRVEFSVHTGPVGYYYKPLVIWQVDRHDLPSRTPSPSWPNRVSAAMGDKAYGLLMADLYGLLVPATTVMGRVFPQFRFGTSTHSGESLWIRTCPQEEAPGKYATRRVWEDPFLLMQKEDPDGTKIASLITQEGVKPDCSGALVTDASGNLVIEGKSGEGNRFMTGEEGPEHLPARVLRAVETFYKKACERFGEIRAEWVFDGDEVWCVQLHLGRSASSGRVIYQGEPERWEEFPVSHGLEALREFAAKAQENGFGIILKGNVGVTGHFAEVLCKKKVPSRIES